MLTIIGVVSLVSLLSKASPIPSAEGMEAPSCPSSGLADHQTCCYHGHGAVLLDIVNPWINDLNNENTKVYTAPPPGNNGNEIVIKGSEDGNGVEGYSVNRDGKVANAIASQLARGLQDLIDKCQSDGSVHGRAAAYGDGDFILDVNNNRL